MHFDLTQSTASYKSCAATSLAARSRPTPRSGIGPIGLRSTCSESSGSWISAARWFRRSTAARMLTKRCRSTGYGYILDSKVARLYLDSKILEIGEATNEIQPVVIARALGC